MHNHGHFCDLGAYRVRKVQSVKLIHLSFVRPWNPVRIPFQSKSGIVMAKLMWPLAKLMSGTMRKMMEKDLDELTAVAESGD